MDDARDHCIELSNVYALKQKRNLLTRNVITLEKNMNCSPRNCHRLLKKVTRRGGVSHVASVIKDGKRRLLFESKDKRLHWRRYVTSLYNNSSRNTETTALKGQPSGEPVLREQVESALKSIRLEKTNG